MNKLLRVALLGFALSAGVMTTATSLAPIPAMADPCPGGNC